jgi:hypothetical protein
MKICIKCNEKKELHNFYKSNRNKIGYEGTCKICKNTYTKTNKKKLGKEYSRQAAKKWVNKNKDKISQYNKEKYNNNKEYWLSENRKLYHKEWKKNNKDKLKEYANKKYKEDINYKLASLLRHRLYFALKLNIKTKSALKLLGCSINDFKNYLKLQFKPEMNWDNHGDIWEIDHIKPCDSFDLTDIEQQKQCFHYTNIQPLFKTTEVAKSFGYNELGNRNKTNKYLLI